MIDKDNFTQKIAKQYDFRPYPDQPIEAYLNNDSELLFWNSLVTNYYLTSKTIIDTEGKLILDVGCGTGWKSLGLVIANPGAKVVGIDISSKSIDLAKKRLEYHGFGLQQVEFHVLAVEDLTTLGKEFDYINCDEVLFFLPDPVTGLRAMKSVLKKAGIIRANLHSLLQRDALYRLQKFLKLLGFMEDNPEELEINIVLEIMENLRDDVDVKIKTWQQMQDASQEDKRSFIIRDLLLMGDKGYTIPEMFEMLRQANLEFIGMVNQQDWQIWDLFEDKDNPLAFLALTIPELSIEEQLHLCELLHPINRKLDFWCGHYVEDRGNLQKNSSINWENLQVQLHPMLINNEMKQKFLDSIQQQISLDLGKFLGLDSGDLLVLNHKMTKCLLGLYDQSLSFSDLVKNWLTLHEDLPEKQAITEFQNLLMFLEMNAIILFNDFGG